MDLGLAVAALVGAVLAAAVLMLGAAPAIAGKPVLVVAPPWSEGAVAISRAAGGQLVGPVTAPFGVLAVFEGEVPAGALRDLGAWAVRGGETLAAICGVTPG